MDQSNSDPVLGTLDFFILNIVQSERLRGVAIQHRVEQQTPGLFQKLRLRRGSFNRRLTRLEHVGWLATEWRPTDGAGAEKIYSLTSAGKKRLEEEWTNRKLGLARFVDESLDDSFKRFLSRGSNSEN